MNTYHSNFPKAIEQNFARLKGSDATLLLDSLSEAELSDLAQLYVNAVSSGTGHQPRLLHVLAHRLDAKRLGRLSSHFGFGAVYDAVNSVSTAKSQDFLDSSNVNSYGPVPGRLQVGPRNPHAVTRPGLPKPMLFRPNTDGGGRFIKTQAGWGQFMNLTPYEIYLAFRTAPVGALDYTGALWESSVILSKAMLGSFGTGYAIGTYVIAPLIQNYAPSLWDAIGGTISNMIDTLSNSWGMSLVQAGQVQQDTAIGFQSTIDQQFYFATSAGDWETAYPWAYNNGGAFEPTPYWCLSWCLT